MEILNPFNVRLENTILIEASAGTGKTYTITSIYTRLVCRGYRPDSILVVTFTEAAAAELQLRIRKRLSEAYSFLTGFDGEPRERAAIDDELKAYLLNGSKEEIKKRVFYLKRVLRLFDETSILTIHSFCLKMLKENAFESRTLFDIELSSDSSLIEKEVCFDFFSEYINDLDPLFLGYLKKVNFTPERLINKFSGILSRPDIDLLPEKVEFADVFDEYRSIVSDIKIYVENRDEEIRDYIKADSEINRQSYRKDLVAKWIEQINIQISEAGDNTVFSMQEKGDTPYKFTLTRLSEKSKSDSYSSEYEFFILCEKILELSRVFENNILSLELKYYDYLKKRLADNKETNGIVFFNDLINDLAYALDEKSGNKGSAGKLISAIQEKYQAALIDEFQDTDQTQYSIFSKLFAKRKNLFCMIGDPKQAIYGFRGGDIFAYLKAVEDSSRIYTLDKNYRSDPMIVESVNSIFMKKENPFLYEKIEFFPVSTPESSVNRLSEDGNSLPGFRFLYLKKTDESESDSNFSSFEIKPDKNGIIPKKWANDNIPSITAQDITTLLLSDTRLKGDPVRPSDIAVLVRKNEQAVKIRAALMRFGVPSHIYNDDSVFKSEEAQGMIDLLYGVLEPGNDSFVKAALTTDVFEFDGNDINQLNCNEELFSSWKEKFRHYHAVWVEKGFTKMIQEVFYSKDAFSKEPSYINERTLTNYNHLIELIHDAESTQNLSPAFLLQWLKNEQAKKDKGLQAEEIRLETDKPAVSIITIHKSKGLEWPVVYLPYLWDSKNNASQSAYLFHDPDESFKEKYDIGSENIDRARSFSENESEAEDVRLLYVALTRASSMVNIIWGSFKSMESSALGSILHGGTLKDDSDYLDDIRGLGKNGFSGLTVDFYEPLESGFYLQQYSDADPLESKKSFSRSVFQLWKISSFSSLTANAEGVFSEKKENAAVSSKEEILLKDFPAGAGSGEFFHSLLEDLDFECDETGISDLIESKLLTFGYKPEYFKDIIEKALSDILSAPLVPAADGGIHEGFSLKQIDREKRLNELEFFFPVRSLDVMRLYRIFKDYMAHPVSSDYAEKLLELEFSNLSGFMKGFIDLTFEYDHKWYIVDYKSNFLGKTYEDYSSEAVNRSMLEHHYFLQYHIYVAALHKYLKFRQKDYNYDTHFGGVFYLYLRGMKPGRDPVSGVFFDRPDFELIKRLIQHDA